MLSLTPTEMADLADNIYTIFTLAKLEELSVRQLGRYLKNQAFRDFYYHVVGVEKGSRHDGQPESIQAWLDQASMKLIKKVCLFLSRFATPLINSSYAEVRGRAQGT